MGGPLHSVHCLFGSLCSFLKVHPLRDDDTSNLCHTSELHTPVVFWTSMYNFSVWIQFVLFFLKIIFEAGPPCVAQVIWSSQQAFCPSPSNAMITGVSPHAQLLHVRLYLRARKMAWWVQVCASLETGV